MKTFLYKEFKLAIPLPLILFSVLGIMTMIPNYPIFIGLFYSLIAIFVMFSIQKDNRDIEFSLTLPVTRKYIVASKISIIILLQILSVIFSTFGALLANFCLSPSGNLVGSDPNIAFFGMGFIAFSIFNIIFIPWFFKSGYKLNLPIFIAIMSFVVCFVLYEILIAAIPTFHKVFDTLNPKYFGYQSILLACGIPIYCGTIYLTYRLAVKNFEKVNI